METIHIVVLEPNYAAANMPWLQRFVFHREVNKSCSMYFFSCFRYKVYAYGMLEAEVFVKGKETNVEREVVLLPLHAVAGLLLDQSPRNPLGFVSDQSECHE